ncbi:hypothetical protein ACF0H5_023223 [Mactra antiquata]
MSLSKGKYQFTDISMTFISLMTKNIILLMMKETGKAACRHINIPHCKPGQQSCGGSPDGVKCTQCQDPYYSGGYNRGCLECPRINHCTARHCTTPSDTICSECEGNNVLFKLSPDRKSCERMCSHQNDYCWPGTCGSELTKNCQCARNFTRVLTASQTTCQPNIPPEIQTCGTVVTGPNGERVQALSSSSSTECKNLQDMYGNFQPVQLTFDMVSSFTLPKPNDAKPRFIKEHNFGVTDTNVYIEKISVSGSRSRLSSHQQLVDRSSGASANAYFASEANITMNRVLSDGETLCAVFEAFGGGYLKSINVMSSNSVSVAIPYRKIKQTEQVCYRFDSSKPMHCKEKDLCNKEPLTVSRTITSSSIQTIYVDMGSWFDPVPARGKAIQASQIESYEIRVNEVNPSSDVSTVYYTKTIFSRKTTADVNEMTLNLTSDSPRLYCITLEVTDVAKNPRQARRFILYDNTTFIESRNDKPFIVSSASSQTEFKWQTHHHDICLSWKDHFFNRYYLDNKLLNPIAPEPNGLIQGVYEHLQAPLSVNGTPNTDGIISFMVAWNVNGDSFSKEVKVSDFLNQTFCKNVGVKDGDIYTFQIRPIDIVGHTYAENRTVGIDRSVPHIKNIWLTKAGYLPLFVHDSRDLSKMVFTFDAIDPHSGISSIKYSFGVADDSLELTTGMLAVKKLSNSTCPKAAKCYCPDIGSCEMYNYSIALNKLVQTGKHEGDNNRSYVFTIKVTNNAMLSNIERVDILVDDSFPGVGVMYEVASTMQTGPTQGITSSINEESLLTTEATVSSVQHADTTKLRTWSEKQSVNNDDNNNTVLIALCTTVSVVAVVIIALVGAIIYYRRRIEALKCGSTSKEINMNNANNQTGQRENEGHAQVVTDI